jgi:hypothetical protein
MKRFLNRSHPNFLIPLAPALLLLIVAGFAWSPLTGGVDFWAHASIGRWILENGRFPTETLFLWSEKQPWIAHAWATGVFFTFLMRIGGESGGPVLALLFNVLMSALPFALLWSFWRRNAPFSSVVPVIFAIAIWAGAARFHPRPELFTALFMTLLLLFLMGWMRQNGGSKAQVFGILVMFALWPNFHGAVAVGLALLWVSALCEWIQSRARDFRMVLLAAICTLLVFVCNPRGFDYYRVLLPIASSTFQKIDEWKPFWGWPRLATELVIAEILLWVTGMILWAKNPNRRLAQLGWMLLMGAAFLQARRQLWLTAITSLAVIVSNARPLQSDNMFRGWRQISRGDVSQPIPAPMRLIARAGILVVLLCAVGQAFSKDFWPPRATNRKLPVEMANFLREKAPPGRILNDYEFSSYLQWGLRGKRTLYIDLNNAYPDTLMNEYFEMLSSSKKPEVLAKYDVRRGQILDDRKIQVVALRPFTNKEGLSMLATYLNKNPNWKRIYKRVDGTVWARI